MQQDGYKNCLTTGKVVMFWEFETRTLKEVKSMTDLEIYLKSETLANLIVQLKSKGISQRTFAESKLRNRFYNELGAAKLAAIWIMEHIADVEK